MTPYNIQILTSHGWSTGFLGKLSCTLGELLDALAQAMPERKLRIGASASGVTKIWLY